MKKDLMDSLEIGLNAVGITFAYLLIPFLIPVMVLGWIIKQFRRVS